MKINRNYKIELCGLKYAWFLQLYFHFYSVLTPNDHEVLRCQPSWLCSEWLRDDDYRDFPGGICPVSEIFITLCPKHSRIAAPIMSMDPRAMWSSHRVHHRVPARLTMTSPLPKVSPRATNTFQGLGRATVSVDCLTLQNLATQNSEIDLAILKRCAKNQSEAVTTTLPPMTPRETTQDCCQDDPQGRRRHLQGRLGRGHSCPMQFLEAQK